MIWLSYEMNQGLYTFSLDWLQLQAVPVRNRCLYLMRTWLIRCELVKLPSFRTAALTIICSAYVQLLVDWNIEISCECVISPQLALRLHMQWACPNPTGNSKSAVHVSKQSVTVISFLLEQLWNEILRWRFLNNRCSAYRRTICAKSIQSMTKL